MARGLTGSHRDEQGGIMKESNRHRPLFVALIVVAVIATTASAAGTAGTAGAATSAPGVTSDAIKIGFITSKTGAAASSNQYSDLGCKARVGAENAKGGVNGRKIEVVYKDDATSNNLGQAQDLVQNDHVYLVVNDSALAFTTYRWLLENNVPLIGGGFDGNYYGAPGNEKIVSAFGNGPPIATIQTNLMPEVMKSLGAKKVAALGYGSIASSVASVKSFMQYAVPSVGLDPTYTNTSIEFGTTDVGSLALGIKNAGADSGYYAMDLSTNLALTQALQQNNVDMKAQVLATGYGQNLLDQPVSKTIGSDVVFGTIWAPVEAKTAAVKRLQSELKKYADYTGTPDIGVYTGYVACDLAVIGLEQQGNDLVQSSFVDKLRSVGTVNPGDGLGCSDINLSVATYGKIVDTGDKNQRACEWFLRLKDGRFVIYKQPGSRQTYWTGDLVKASVPPEYTVPATTRAK
jgi:ABC-type branched-subunit amino acid transport system substrate-binding protein